MSRRASGSNSVQIKSQILKAFGLVLFLFALVVGLNYYFLSQRTGQGSTLFHSVSKIDQLTLHMKDYLFNAQDNAHLFLLNRDTSKVEETKTFIGKLLDSTEKLKKDAEKNSNSEGASAAAKVREHIELYSKTFQQLTDAVTSGGIDNTSGLRGQLNTAGSQFNSFASRNEAGDLALALLLVQVHQKEYLKNRDEASLNQLTAAVEKLKQIAIESQIDPLEAQILRKSVKKYIFALDKHLAVSLGTNDPKLAFSLSEEEKRQTDAMRTEANEIELLINRINAQVSTQLASMNQGSRIKSLISRVNVPHGASLVNNIRQHETDYLLYGNVTSVDKFDNALDTLINAYNSSSILIEHKKELIQAAKQYSDIFHSYVENSRSIRTLTSKLDNTASALLAQINEAAAKTASTPDLSPQAPPDTTGTSQLGLVSLGAGLLVIIVGLLIALQLGRSISAPINTITQNLRRIIREEDFSVGIPITSKNETGTLAMKLNELLQLKQNEPNLAMESSTLQSPDMQELADISVSLNNHLMKLTEINNKVIDSASTHDNLTLEAEAAIIKMTESLDTFKQVLETKVEPDDSPSDTDQPLDISTKSALDSMKEISQSTSQISDLLSLSSDLAEQTNLLALNATVKAARAGSHSKEFSLIADELAQMAQRSENVAKETGQLTAVLAEKVQNSAALVTDFTPSKGPQQGTGGTALVMEVELSRQIETLSSAIEELNKVLEDSNTATEKIRACAEEQAKESEAAQNAVTMFLEKSSRSETTQKEAAQHTHSLLAGTSDSGFESNENDEETAQKSATDNGS